MKETNEIRKIIDILSNGKITAVEAEKLMSALKNTSKPVKKGSRIVFNISEEGNPKPKVNIAVPIALAKMGMKFIPEDAIIKANLSETDFDFNSINWKEIIQMASSGELGDLFYLEAEDNGKTMIIRIFVE